MGSLDTGPIAGSNCREQFALSQRGGSRILDAAAAAALREADTERRGWCMESEGEGRRNAGRRRRWRAGWRVACGVAVAYAQRPAWRRRRYLFGWAASGCITRGGCGMTAMGGADLGEGARARGRCVR